MNINIAELETLVDEARGSIQRLFDHARSRKLDLAANIVILIRGDSPLAVCVPAEIREKGERGVACALVLRSDLANVLREFAADTADEIVKPAADGTLWILISTLTHGTTMPLSDLEILPSN